MENYKIRHKFFVDTVKENYDPEAVELILRSTKFAESYHLIQKRKSGEPFMIHPLETAIKLVEWKMDVQSICAGLLHDILEDTEVTEQELEDQFGPEITMLVKLVTKISLIGKKNREAQQLKNLASNYQIQVFLSISKDIRAIIIKLADRFHNLSTIQYLSPERQKSIAQETFDIYANIAGRLGMYNVKTQLLDNSFYIINYEAYNNTLSLINEYRLVNEQKWQAITEKIQNLLNDEKINFTFESRIKGVYSTYNKLNMIPRINNIHDVFALRIILDNELDIYHVLGLIHLNFKYIPKFFKDYVSAPKNNLYQSIHTTIIDDNTLVEIQIRTKWMDANSRLGLASHWLYKEKNNSNSDATTQASQLFQVDLFLESSNKDSKMIRELTKIPIVDVIVTNVPKTYSIPASSTVLDLAYQVDQQKFPYINAIFRFGERIPWDTQLENGDAIEITYADKPKINERWTRYISNPTVRKNILQHIHKQENTEINSVQTFIQQLNNNLKDKRVTDNEIMKRLKILNLNSIREYIEYMNVLHMTNQDEFEFFSKGNKWKNILKEIRRHSNRWIFNQSYFELVEGLKINRIEIPKCCTKIPYMQVVGVTVKNKLYVHNPNCKILDKKNDHTKLIPLRWNKKRLEKHPRKFRSHVEIRGTWSESVVNTIVLNTIKNQGSLHEFNINRDKVTQQFCANLILYVADLNKLNLIMSELIVRNINFVWKII